MASQFLEVYLEPVGLHASQYGMLRQVSKAGSLSMTQLADLMYLDRTTLTRNLQVLEREGLVAIVSGTDKRVREIALTDKGREIFEQAVPLWEQAETALAERLGAGKREAMLDYVAALITLDQK